MIEDVYWSSSLDCADKSVEIIIIITTIIIIIITMITIITIIN